MLLLLIVHLILRNDIQTIRPGRFYEEKWALLNTVGSFSSTRCRLTVALWVLLKHPDTKNDSEITNKSIRLSFIKLLTELLQDILADSIGYWWLLCLTSIRLQVRTWCRPAVGVFRAGRIPPNTSFEPVAHRGMRSVTCWTWPHF